MKFPLIEKQLNKKCTEKERFKKIFDLYYKANSFSEFILNRAIAGLNVPWYKFDLFATHYLVTNSRFIGLNFLFFMNAVLMMFLSCEVIAFQMPYLFFIPLLNIALVGTICCYIDLKLSSITGEIKYRQD